MKKRAGILTVLLLALVLLGSCATYLNSYYRADAEALAIVEAKSSYEVLETKDKEVVLLPSSPKAGFIFYPGGKVQYEAYLPLLGKLAENGVLCVLLHMPGNLAVLDSNAALGVQERFPQVKDWYIGGHSLGGAMAAYHVAGKGEGRFSGLVLLGAYSTKDLSKSGLKVLSVYGSEDGVMKRDSYEKDLANLPADFREVVIQGGCHAYFGSYGAQKGDGTPTIGREEQLEITALEILKMMED